MGREMRSESFELPPALAGTRDALARFLETDFQAVVTPSSAGAGAQARIGDLTLALSFLRPQEQRLSLYDAGDWQLQVQAHARIERIAERSNARLAAGEHQQHVVRNEALQRRRTNETDASPCCNGIATGAPHTACHRNPAPGDPP